MFMKSSFGAFGVTLAHAERKKGMPTASFSQLFNNSQSHTVDRQTFVDIKYRRTLAVDTEFSMHAYVGRQAYYGDYAYDKTLATVNRDGSRAGWWGADIKWLSTRFDRHKLIAGVDLQHDHRRDQYNYAHAAQGLESAALMSATEGHASEDVFNDHRQGRRLGAYLQDEFAIRDDLLFNMGMRYDHNSTTGGMVNPRLALIYHPRKSTAIKTLYGTAYRAPSAYEWYYAMTDGGGQKSNPTLRAERIRSAEFVLEHHFTTDSRLTALLFHNTVSQLISLTTDPADNLLVYRNLDRAIARGAELEFEQLYPGGAKLRTSVSLQRTTDRATGALLANSPKRLAKLNFSTPLFHDALRAALEAQYVGRRRTLADQVASYWIVNLSLFSAHVATGLELSAGVYNVFDRRFADPGSEEHVQDAIVQDGRSFRVKLCYSF